MSIRQLIGALALGAMAAQANATEFFLSDFVSVDETALGTTSVWQYNNVDKAPWTAGWDGDSSLTFDFGAPIAPGENHRLRAPLTAPTPLFSDFPYTKVKVTFSGIPDGDTVLFQIRQELSSGYIKRTWPVGNGTHVLTFDGTDIPNFDSGSNHPFDPALSSYFRIRLQIDLTTIPTWATAYADVAASIDYVVITDDPTFGEEPGGEGEGVVEGEGAPDGEGEGTVEGEGEGTAEGEGEGTVDGEGEGEVPVEYSYTRELGDDITITVPNPGAAVDGDFTWTFSPAAGGATQTLAENGDSLTLTKLTPSDSGTYVATFDDGAKVQQTFIANLTVVNALPATSGAALAALASALGAIGLLGSGRKRRT